MAEYENHGKKTRRGKAADIEARVQAVYLLLVSGTRYDEIVAYGAETWKLGERIIHKYINRARVMMKEEAAAIRANFLENALARHKSMIHQALVTGDARLALDIDKEDAKLLGAYAPDKNYNLDIDLSKLTNEQLERIANGEDPVTVLKSGAQG